jgi:hypothetical protein
VINLMFEKLIENVSSISKSTIKDRVASVSVGHAFKSLFTKLVQRSGWSALSRINVGMFVGGIVADYLVANVKEKLELNSLRNSLNAQADHLFIVASETRRMNNGLEALIW